LSRIARSAGEESHPLLMTRSEKKVEGIVVTSDKGLCGAFNSNLLAEASAFFSEKAQSSEVRLILIGKKALNHFRKQDFPIDRTYAERTDRLNFPDFRNLAQFLIRLYVLNQTDGIYAAYNEFRSIVSPRVTIARLLPLVIPEPEGEDFPHLPADWAPQAPALLISLLPLYVESQLYHCLVESQAAEQAARMMAMDNATQNAEELISNLVLLLNKIRQASITQELLEIMTAVEALGK
jgi:F-type H+-transporting ATPase subunit gamma